MLILMRRATEHATIEKPYILTCPGCYKEYGRVSADELRFLQMDTALHAGLCFDCEKDIYNMSLDFNPPQNRRAPNVCITITQTLLEHKEPETKAH